MSQKGTVQKIGELWMLVEDDKKETTRSSDSEAQKDRVIKEQQAEIETLRSEIRALREELALLRPPAVPRIERKERITDSVDTDNINRALKLKLRLFRQDGRYANYYDQVLQLTKTQHLDVRISQHGAAGWRAILAIGPKGQTQTLSTCSGRTKAEARERASELALWKLRPEPSISKLQPVPAPNTGATDRMKEITTYMQEHSALSPSERLTDVRVQVTSDLTFLAELRIGSLILGEATEADYDMARDQATFVGLLQLHDIVISAQKFGDPKDFRY